MAKTKRTTKLQIDLGNRKSGGTNTTKKEYLFLTKEVINKAREFFTDFFLTHSLKFDETVLYFSEKEQKEKGRKINNKEILSWSESLTLKTKENSIVLVGYDFKSKFPDMPRDFRRSAINDSIGRVRSHLSNYKNWKASGKTKGKPGLPKAVNYPTLYKEVYDLDLEKGFISLKVFDGSNWKWINYPIKNNRWLINRLSESEWKTLSPTLVIKEKYVGLHFPQEKVVSVKKVKDSKKDKGLFTVAVDLNVKNLAVVTVRQYGKIIYTEFIKDEGLDQHRYQHLKVISFKQYQSGKPVKGENSNQKLWIHIRKTNDDFAHKAARRIAEVCKNFHGSVLLFEALRKIKRNGGTKSRRLNRKLANQIKGKINQYSKEKAFIYGTVTVEVNPHGTSQYCSYCGEKGERFSHVNGKREVHKGGKLFYCKSCGYTVNADYNASVNIHRSFYKEFHWEWKENKKKKPKSA